MVSKYINIHMVTVLLEYIDCSLQLFINALTLLLIYFTLHISYYAGIMLNAFISA